MIYTKPELASMAIDTAVKVGVPPALVCAIIEVSSSWNPGLSEWEPEGWLLQIHPNDLKGGEEEFLAVGTRWGLMQFMGSRAKQAGYTGKISRELGEPRANLEAGCTILKNLMGNGRDLKNVVGNWYGFQRRAMTAFTLALLPKFEEFVAARPVAGTIHAD